MKRYTPDNQTVIALASMMTDAEAEEEIRIFCAAVDSDPVDMKLMERLHKLIQKAGGIAAIEAEIDAAKEEDPDHLLKIAAVLRLERAP